MADDDWEEKMLDQLERLLSNMGMNMSREQLRALLQQFRSQFEKMGIDEERIAKGDVNFNFDLSNLKNFFQPGMDFNELFKNMGVDVRVDASPVEIETPDGDEKDDMVLPADDVYLEGWNMTITVDFAKKELEQDQVELNLIDGGMLVEVHRTTQLAPIARIELPHACEDVVDFTLNNGILDITLRLIPPEDALAALPPSEDGDDAIPLSGDIAIDLADDDDDDDDDDGGIPIL
tara:strand:+ start:36 stop:737 length:702 start_codon:yes stop_codon:yes gene_type:complete